jgi:NitT/TauT family transport system permease protein
MPAPELFAYGAFFVADPARRIPGSSSHRPPLTWHWLILPVSLAAGLGLWYAFTHPPRYPAYILPGPGQVWGRFQAVLRDGTLGQHALVSLTEAVCGLLLGLTTASVLGYFIAKSRTLERALTPYIVASQAVPVIAIAPLLVIWLGFGLRAKILICALTVFFPILVNTVLGVRSVEPNLRDLMRSLRATRWQTFVKLELPAALPILLGGLKIGATLSVIGAVVGEFVSRDRGLGFLLDFARGQYDTALVFVAVATLVVMALSLYALVALLEKVWLRWNG